MSGWEKNEWMCKRMSVPKSQENTYYYLITLIITLLNVRNTIGFSKIPAIYLINWDTWGQTGSHRSVCFWRHQHRNALTAKEQEMRGTGKLPGNASSLTPLSSPPPCPRNLCVPLLPKMTSAPLMLVAPNIDHKNSQTHKKAKELCTVTTHRRYHEDCTLRPLSLSYSSCFPSVNSSWVLTHFKGTCRHRWLPPKKRSQDYHSLVMVSV